MKKIYSQSFLFCFFCLLFAACQNEKAVSDLDGETGEALLAKVLLNGKYGYINTAGDFIIEPEYLNAYSFSEGLACVYLGGHSDGNHLSGGYYGYIDHRGEILIPGKFPGPGTFHHGFARIRIGENQYRFIDRQGNYIGPVYDEMGIFNERLAPAVLKKEGRMGYIDQKGNWNIAFQLGSFIGPFSNGKAYVKSNKGMFGYIDKSGGFVIEPAYENAHIFSEGFAGVKDKNLYGFIKEDGSLWIPHQYGSVLQFNEGLCAVRVDGYWGFIDKTGKEVIEAQFESVSNFKNGLCTVRPTMIGPAGYIDKEGKIVIEPSFDQASDFNFGLAAVSKDSLVFFINTSGEIEINEGFSYAGPFVNIEATTPEKDW